MSQRISKRRYKRHAIVTRAPACTFARGTHNFSAAISSQLDSHASQLHLSPFARSENGPLEALLPPRLGVF